MTDFLSLIGAIPSLISQFSGNTTAPYQKQQQQLAGQQSQISQALTQGPNNPLYQQIYGGYKQQNANQAASTIAELQGENRMNANLGRTPLFSNERGSENIFRSLMQQQQGAGLQADQQTRAALQGASGPTLAAQGQDGNLTNYTTAANKAQNAGYQNIYDMLKGFGVGQPQHQSTGSMGAGNYTNLANSTQQSPYAGFMGQSVQPYGVQY